MSFNYYSQVEEAQMRRDELLRVARAARLATHARSNRPSLLGRIWRFALSGIRLSPAKPARHISLLTTRVEKRVNTRPTLYIRPQESVTKR